MTAALRSGVELIADLQRSEAAHASTKATLTEHVDENLELHRRCAAHEDRIAELESALSNLVESSAAHVEALEAEVARWKALAESKEAESKAIIRAGALIAEKLEGGK